VRSVVAMSRSFGVTMDSRVAWPFAALVALLVFNLVFSSDFLTFQVRDGRLYGGLVDIFENAAPLILVAAGVAIVIGTGGIDLSVGSVMAISGTVAAGMIARPEYSVFNNVGFGGSILPAISLAIVTAGIAGLLNGTLVGILGVQPLMATLVLMVAGRGVAQLLSDGQIITFREPAMDFLGSGAWLGLPVAIWISLCGVVFVAVIVRVTAIGFLAEAIGDNRTAAALSGVPVRPLVMFAYVITGLLAGVAGILVVCDIGAADSIRAGRDKELDAILAVVLGGTTLSGGRFSILGAVIGALLIQTLTTTILAQGIVEDSARLVKGGVVIAICLLQSDRFRSGVTRAWKWRRSSTS